MTRKDLIFGILLTLISLAVSLLGLEIYVRLVLKDQVDTDALKAALQVTSVKSLVQPSPDPLLYFELKPGRLYQWGSSLRRPCTGFRSPGHRGSLFKNTHRYSYL